MAFSNGAELLKGALKKSGEPTNGNSKYQSDALDFLNQSYLALLSGASKFDLGFGEPWPWAIEENSLCVTLLPSVTEGSVNLTEDSATGAFTSAPVLSMVDRHLKVAGREERFKITAHIAGATAFTIECVFPGATAAYGFEAFQFTYDLGTDILRLAGPFRSSRRDYQTSHLSINLFKDNFPIYAIGNGDPTHFTVIKSDDNVHKVMFNASPSEKLLMKIDYVKYPAAIIDDVGSTVDIPLQHKSTLEYMAASEIYFNSKKNPAQGSLMLNLAKQQIRAIQEESSRTNKNSGQNRSRLIPRLRGRTRNRFKNRYNRG
jgi:hypothetical protein